MTPKYYLCLTPFFPTPAHWQGAYVLDQVKAIARHTRCEVVVFRTCALRDRQPDYTIDGVRVHTLRPPLMPSYLLNGLTAPLVGRLFVRKLRRMGIRPADVAVVHCHTASHAAFGLGVRRENPEAKVLVQFHDLDPLTLRNGLWADRAWNRRFRARRSTEALRAADLLVCISEPVRDALLAFPRPRQGEVYAPARDMLRQVADLPPVCPRRVCVLNNGVDTRLFRPAAGRKAGALFRIGCIANFQELKDHRTLVGAFRLLVARGHTDMRLSLLGTGETRPAIEEQIRRCGLAPYVEWPAEMRHSQLPAYYYTLDLFVLPSVYEGFGCVYTEAHACGVPFICCEQQGAAECVAPEERGRWLVPPHDPEALAQRIERQYRERAAQRLCKPTDIDQLVPAFLQEVATL